MGPTLKTCFRCGTPKSRAEFYRHAKMADGLLGKCKDCTKQDVRENRGLRLDYYKQYEYLRYDLNGSRGEASEEARKRGGARWSAANRHKRRAHSAVARAVRSGLLVRQPCAICGSAENVDAHHADYAKPLEVSWLCETHHGEAHRKPRDPNFEPARAFRKRAA